MVPNISTYIHSMRLKLGPVAALVKGKQYTKLTLWSSDLFKVYRPETINRGSHVTKLITLSVNFISEGYPQYKFPLPHHIYKIKKARTRLIFGII